MMAIYICIYEYLSVFPVHFVKDYACFIGCVAINSSYFCVILENKRGVIIKKNRTRLVSIKKMFSLLLYSHEWCFTFSPCHIVMKIYVCFPFFLRVEFYYITKFIFYFSVWYGIMEHVKLLLYVCTFCVASEYFSSIWQSCFIWHIFSSFCPSFLSTVQFSSSFACNRHASKVWIFLVLLHSSAPLILVCRSFLNFCKHTYTTKVFDWVPFSNAWIIFQKCSWILPSTNSDRICCEKNILLIRKCDTIVNA